MRSRGAFVAGCALLALGSGCSSGGGSAKPEPTTVAPTPPTTAHRPTTTRKVVATTTTTTTTTPAPGPLLVSLMLQKAPSKYPLQPDDSADTGPTDLPKAVVDDPLGSDADARAALEGAGFLRGYERQWSSDDGGNQNFVFLYQFATHQGALDYIEHWRSGIVDANVGAAPVAFTPSLIAGAIGLRGRDSSGSSGVVLFAKGPYAVEASAIGSPSADQSLPASALALAQFSLLP